MAAPVSFTTLDSPGGGPIPPAPFPHAYPHPVLAGPSPRAAVSPARASDAPADLMDRIRESFWGDGVPWGWQPPYALFDDDPGFRPGGLGRGVSGTVADRRGGKDLPLFWSEIDLRGFRVLARWLADTNPFMIGFLRRLVDYHIGKGFQWQACLKGQSKQPYATAEAQRETAEGKLVTKAQNILDGWRDANAWGLKSREGFLRLHRDGEVCFRFGVERRGDLPWVRWVEPEQIGSPTGDVTTDASFGRRNAPGDAETILETFIRYMAGSGHEGEWVSEALLVFAKTNTDSTVKRGLPDSFSCHEYFDEARKLVRNMVVTAGAQAAVAWRESFPVASADQVRALIPQGQVNLQVPPWLNGGQTVYSEKLAAGTVLRTEGSREFNPGPVSDGVMGFVEVTQAALRACCVRWGLPPYMTAKADDINFASSLTAGSPFAKAVEGGQVEWGAVERRVAVKVLDLACESGLLTPAERAALDVEVIPPAVTSPDKTADTDRLLGLLREKVVDPYTVQQELGYDPSHIEANWKAWQQRNPGQQPPGTEPPANPPPGGSPGEGESNRGQSPALESVLREHGFTGTDRLGRRWVDGKEVPKAANPGAGPRAGRLAQAAAGVRWSGRVPRHFPRGSLVHPFATSAGLRYDVIAYPDRVGSGDRAASGMEVSFFDSEGRTDVTGAGQAHEVLSKASAAALSLLRDGKRDYITFTAKEPSRQKLYDRLARTVAAMTPGYAAVAVAGEDGSRKYYVFKADKRAAIEAGAEGLARLSGASEAGGTGHPAGVVWLASAAGEEIEEWLVGEDHPGLIREDRSGLVRTTVTDKNGVTRHVWTRPEDADHMTGTGPPAPAGDSQPSAADTLAGLAADFPTEASDPALWGKVKAVAARLHDSLHALAVRATPYILPVVSELIDTPADFARFGYAPSVSGVDAHTGDPIKAATGLSTHLAMSITAKVLAKALVWAKGRLAREGADDPAEAATDWLLALFGEVDKALGVETPVDRAVTLAAVREYLARAGGKGE